MFRVFFRKQTDDYKYRKVELSSNTGTPVNDGGSGADVSYIVNASGTIQTSYKDYTSDIIDIAAELTYDSANKTYGAGFNASPTIMNGFNTGYQEYTSSTDNLANFLLKGSYEGN